jgi:glucose-6-phosphate isomerase
VEGGRHLRHFYSGEQERINVFADRVHSGELRGSTGKPLDTVVQIGIGGSDLGPRALYLALRTYVTARHGGLKMEPHFISNVDPDDARTVLARVDFENALFILVSKSGTTQETLTNRELAMKSMERSGVRGFVPERHFVAVTSKASPLADSSDFLERFYIDDFIGGRYSSTSAVGGAVLTLAFGKEIFREVLEGAHEADMRAMEANILDNASLMDALVGVYERNILGYPITLILPYSQALARFPAHLQQLDMESNGKSVNRCGEPVTYHTGPVVFGEPGTNAQHSVYQFLHQGTETIPLQFIGFEEPQSDFDVEYEGSTSQAKLNANLAAQIIAFAKGRKHEDPNKDFPGGRPSSLLYARQLTPKVLGALLAHFENKIMFQGFAWNINSFDQRGVELGKTLTRQVLGCESVDPGLDAYAGLLGCEPSGKLQYRPP